MQAKQTKIAEERNCFQTELKKFHLEFMPPSNIQRQFDHKVQKDAQSEQDLMESVWDSKKTNERLMKLNQTSTSYSWFVRRN
jgi:hypothetical protein